MRSVSRAREALCRLLLPGGGPRPTVSEAAVVFAVAGSLAFFRFGGAAVHARVWAEDGKVFLQQADQHGPLRSLTISYAGYLHGVPRLAAAAVYPFPVRWWGAGLHLVDSLVVAYVALAVYLGLSDHVRSRAARAVAALYVALVPVGPEITESIANLQWYLVTGAVVVLFWTPRSRWGWAAICIMTLGATTSSPLGALVFGCALVRWLLQRGRGALVVLGATTAGYAAQVVEMLHAPQRHIGHLYGDYGASGLARGYLSRVVGDGVLGMDRLPDGASTSIVAGGVVLLVLALVVVLGAVRRRPGPWALAAVLVAFSVATFLVSTLLQPVPLPLESAIYGARYYVPPALLLVVALIALGAGLVERGRATSADAAGVGERATRSVFGLAFLALVGCLAFALVTTYDEAGLRGRNDTPTWSHDVRLAARTCRTEPGRSQVTVPILPSSPPIWMVRLRCTSLRGV